MSDQQMCGFVAQMVGL